MNLRPEIFFLASVALGLGACGSSAPPAAKAAKPPIVTVAKVERRSVPIALRFSGVVKPLKQIEILPRVEGFIQERKFVEGSDLKAGDELYLIDPRTYEASLAAAKAQLERDQAALKLYDAELKRYEDAGTTGAVSKEQIDRVRAQRDESAAAVEQDRAELQSSELDLEFTRVLAPFDGRVDQTRIDLGELVTAYKTVLTVLTQLDPIYVVFDMSRADYFSLQRSMEKGVIKSAIDEFEVQVTLPDGELYAHTGKLDFLSADIDPTTDTLTTRAVFPNPPSPNENRDLIGGQYVPVSLTVGQKEALLVPQTAIVAIQAGHQVFVVDAKNVVSARRVELGSSVGALRIVEKGLKEGETIVVEGVLKVRPGKPVEPKPAEPNPGDANSAQGQATNSSAAVK